MFPHSLGAEARTALARWRKLRRRGVEARCEAVKANGAAVQVLGCKVNEHNSPRFREPRNSDKTRDRALLLADQTSVKLGLVSSKVDMRGVREHERVDHGHRVARKGVWGGRGNVAPPQGGLQQVYRGHVSRVLEHVVDWLPRSPGYRQAAIEDALERVSHPVERLLEPLAVWKEAPVQRLLRHGDIARIRAAGHHVHRHAG
mmetsp:Transcript_19741/g.63371  ORF Transcript_19741/g.63371 Transcript_19741/m.63371 type:complete len:202 (-) Transcript_19741:874-1479(-)